WKKNRFGGRKEPGPATAVGIANEEFRAIGHNSSVGRPLQSVTFVLGKTHLLGFAGGILSRGHGPKADIALFLDCGQGLAVRRQIKSFVLVQVVGNVADLSTRKGGIADLNFPFGGPGLMGNEKTPVIRGPAYLPDKSHIRAVAVRSRDCSERAGGDVD